MPSQRREPELSVPRRAEPRLDGDRLRAVLAELTACRQLLDGALKDE